MKKLIDYLHFHQGCFCQTPFGILRLSYVNSTARYKAWFTTDFKENEAILNYHSIVGRSFELSEVNPILIPLEDMTTEQVQECDATKIIQRASPVHVLEVRSCSVETFAWALKNYLDIFYLIKDGLAVAGRWENGKVVPKNDSIKPEPEQIGHIAK